MGIPIGIDVRDPQPVDTEPALAWLREVDAIFSTYREDSEISRLDRADPFVYHHKWLFVADDHPSFDVAASKARSRQWISLNPPVNRNRIGRLSYWEREVLSRLTSC